MVQKKRFLEEQLKHKTEELEKKDQEIKWLKQLVDRLMPGANGAA
jgi:nitrate/nitrite-specific signal transduction histidine kinase